MNFRGTICGLMITFFTSFGLGYSYDEHFHGTLARLMWAGIHPAVAEKLAAYNQWVDVSLLNSAMNPIPLVHGRVSRLLHFPTTSASAFDILFSWARKNFLNGQIDTNGHGDIRNWLNAA